MVFLFVRLLLSLMLSSRINPALRAKQHSFQRPVLDGAPRRPYVLTEQADDGLGLVALIDSWNERRVSHMLRPSLRLFRGENVIFGYTLHIEWSVRIGQHTDRPTSCHEILRDHPVGCSLNYKIHANMRDTLLKSLAVSSVYSI